MGELNSGPSCSEATVLNATVLPLHRHPSKIKKKGYFKKSQDLSDDFISEYQMLAVQI